MEWKCEVVYIREGYDRAIVDAKTKDIIVVVSNLDKQFVESIVHEHNKAISFARKDGIEIAKDIYKSNQRSV